MINPKRAPGAPGSMFGVAAHVMRTEGLVRGWYKGIEAGLARQVVYGSSRLSLYQPTLTAITGDRTPTMADRVAAGSLSGVAAAVISSPVEVALVLMTQSQGPRASLLQTFRHIYQTNGVMGYWRGVGPLSGRAAIQGISQVAFYDQCKVWMNDANSKRGLGLSSLQVNLSSTVVTGIFFGTVTMPVEVARVRMTGDRAVPRLYTSMVQTMAKTVREEGMRPMYCALAPYVSRCCTMTIVTFMTLETARDLYLKNF